MIIYVIEKLTTLAAHWVSTGISRSNKTVMLNTLHKLQAKYPERVFRLSCYTRIGVIE